MHDDSWASPESQFLDNPNCKDPEKAGRTLRYNKGKVQFELIPWEWLEVLAVIFTKGAAKYAPHNWKKSLNTEDHAQVVEDRAGSLMRHVVERLKGNRIDPETGCPHIALAAWNCLFIFWYDTHEAASSQ